MPPRSSTARSRPDVDWLGDLRLHADGPPWLDLGTHRTARWWTPRRASDDKERVLAVQRDEVLAGDTRLLPALERAARLIDEDICIMRDGVLVAGCVCAPSHWRLRDKLGAPLAAIHEPVPRYADELAARVDRFVDRLPVGVVVGRRNWTIHETAIRYEPERPAPIGVAPAFQWLRSERQTLHRRARGAVVFAIRTDMVQLRDVPVAVRHALAARLLAEPDDLRQYHVQDRAPGLIAYLQQ